MHLALALLVILIAPADTTRKDAAIRAKAAANAYLTPHQEPEDDVTLFVEWADLNVDGLDDALVLVEGVAWCGSGGCTLLVLEAMNEADTEEEGPYRVAAEISLVHPPVAVDAHQSHAWRDLVFDPHTDRPSVLHFTGETYPYSPADGVKPATELHLVATLFADNR